MKAIVLAAGFGTRLRPLTNNTPKPLLPVGDRPLIQYNLQLLKKYGITEVAINLHYHGEKIREALGDGRQLGMQILYSEEPEILGTGGGMKKAARFLSDGTFLAINGDILVDINLDKVVEFHRLKKAAATMVLREDPQVDTYGAIELDSEDRIRRFLGRPVWQGKKLSPYMFTGIHVLEPRILEYIPSHGFSPITDAYVAMLKKNEGLFGYLMKGYWRDLGTPESYQQAKTEIKEGTVRLSYAP
ncbi:MAG TPA: NDP-sugar synthase [Nitrospiria bacterium]|jgi:NDP-sugar pyrophosphorylase family protein|nr:NDP-sugar synthase [Nitrospiria bacterium]